MKMSGGSDPDDSVIESLFSAKASFSDGRLIVSTNLGAVAVSAGRAALLLDEDLNPVEEVFLDFLDGHFVAWRLGEEKK